MSLSSPSSSSRKTRRQSSSSVASTSTSTTTTTRSSSGSSTTATTASNPQPSEDKSSDKGKNPRYQVPLQLLLPLLQLSIIAPPPFTLSSATTTRVIDRALLLLPVGRVHNTIP